ILVLALLGILINPLLADDSYQYMESGENGVSVYHTVNVNEQVKVVVFNVYSGKQSANAVFDYSQNIIAYHMPYKGICVIAHMDIARFPSLGFFNKFIHTKREKKKELAKLLKNYDITDEQVSDLSQFGHAVDGLCWGIPTYWAEENYQPRREFGAGGCAGIKFLFIHVGLCGGIHL
ncbi:hypothetical protein GDO86_006584, partial [Hymenochirus boettgeri]